MSQVLRQETAVFLLSVLHGTGLSFFYDLIRCLRRTFRHGLLAVSAEDFLFWTAAGFLTFCLAFFRTDGVIRGYVAAGIAIGAVLYHFTLSRAAVEAFSLLFLEIRRVIRLILQIVSKPLKKTGIFLKKPVEFMRKNAYNVFRKNNEE